MQIKALIIIFLTFCLSACGHFKDRLAKTKTQTQTQIEEPQSEITKAAQDSPQVISAQVIDAFAEENNQSTNLLSRLRAGFSLPELHSPHIQQYQRWSIGHPSYLTNLLKRAEPFLYHIINEIEKRGLPTELALLPAVESAFKPDAVSRSRAVGLWQFMSATGRAYDLEQNWWYDGRKDALAATDAALDYLTELNELFDGDWFLTLAAYNAGPGTIKKAIRRNLDRNKKTDYQSLKLRVETERYVPKLQALKNIISQPEKFGVTLYNLANQPYFEVINLPSQVDLQNFANEAEIDLGQLRRLNAGYKRWATPPDGPHRLLMPLSGLAKTALAVAKFKTSPKIKFHRHEIRLGETLNTIARQYDISVSAIQNSNKLRGSAIRAGKTLMIPLNTNSVTDVAHSRKRPLSSTTENSSLTPTQNKQRIHHVAKGDTLWSISRRYQVKIEQLLSWNKLAINEVLRLNQALLIFAP